MNKKEKRFFKAIVAMSVALVFLTPVTAFANVDETEIENQSVVGTPVNPISRDIAVSSISSIELVSGTSSANNVLAGGTDVLVLNDAESDCQNPAVVTDRAGNVLVLSEIIKGTRQTAVWGRWSTDSGETWSGDAAGWDNTGIGGATDSIERPKLDFYEDKWAYGTWTAGPDYDGAVYYVELPDITDPTYNPNGYGWVFYSVDWGAQQFSDFDSADVACFPYDESTSPSSAFWGCAALTGYKPAYGTSSAEDHTMMFSYFLPGDQVTIISFYDMDYDVYKTSCDIDQSLGLYYWVMEYVNETDPTDDGSYFVKAPPLRPDNYAGGDYWWDGDFPEFFFEDVYNPNIAAADGSVYIVGESIVDGYRDIICLYSSNAGVSFGSSAVTTTPSDNETFPSVTVAGDKVICTYTRNGNLYASISSDGGVTWAETGQVNDPDGTVVEQYSGASMDSQYVVWTDDRNSPDPTEVYLDTVEVAIPIIEITSISGGLGVSATIKNTGTGDVTNVVWSITVKGGLLGFINKTVDCTIPSLAVGAESDPLKTGIFLGLGKIVIKVAVTCDEGASDEETVTGMQIIIFTRIS